MVRSKILILLALIFLPTLAHAQLTCRGEGQAFITPEYFEKDTISIPCRLTSEVSLNASCVGAIFFEGELLSTYPELTDIDLFGREAFVTLNKNKNTSSFVISFMNRDLLHGANFSWEVICKEFNGRYYSTNGSFVVEYPFAQISLGWVMTLFQRDFPLLMGLLFLLIFILVFVYFMLKVMGLIQ